MQRTSLRCARSPLTPTVSCATGFGILVPTAPSTSSHSSPSSAFRTEDRGSRESNTQTISRSSAPCRFPIRPSVHQGAPIGRIALSVSRAAPSNPPVATAGLLPAPPSRLSLRLGSPQVAPLFRPSSRGSVPHISLESVLSSHGVLLRSRRRAGSSASRQPFGSFVFFSHLEEHQLRIAEPGTDPVFISPPRHPGRTRAHSSRRPTPACSGLASLAADAYVRPMASHP